MPIRFDPPRDQRGCGALPPDELAPEARAPDPTGAAFEGEALDALLRREIGVLSERLRQRGAGMLRPSASAGDLVQEAFVGLLHVRPRRSFENPAALRAYLWKAAWRLLLRRAKRPLRDLAPLPSASDGDLRGSTPESPVERREPRVALRVAMALLSEEDRRILELVYLRELGIPAAAQELGIRPEAANMRAVRARRRLAEKLTDWADLIG